MRAWTALKDRWEATKLPKESPPMVIGKPPDIAISYDDWIKAARKDKDLALLAIFDERFARLRLRYVRHSVLVRGMPDYTDTPDGFIENETFTILKHGNKGSTILWPVRSMLPEESEESEDAEEEDVEEEENGEEEDATKSMDPVLPVAWHEERMTQINQPIAIASLAKGAVVRDAHNEEHKGDTGQKDNMEKIKHYGLGMLFGVLGAVLFMWMIDSGNNQTPPPPMEPLPITEEISP